VLWQHPVWGWHIPDTQTSTLVQSLSEVQHPVIGVCTHVPFVGSHCAVLQGFAGQITGVDSQSPVVGLHAETVHRSGGTHTFCCVWQVWVPRLHVAIVHRLGAVQSASSSQHPGIGGPTHCPLAVQASGPVQTRWSSQAAPVLGTFWQPVAGSHESVVQTLLSLQSTGL
jgi:hypothetical protein